MTTHTDTEALEHWAETLADPNFSLSVPSVAKKVILDLLVELRQERELTADLKVLAAGRVEAWRLTEANKALSRAEETIERMRDLAGPNTIFAPEEEDEYGTDEEAAYGDGADHVLTYVRMALTDYDKTKKEAERG